MSYNKKPSDRGRGGMFSLNFAPCDALFQFPASTSSHSTSSIRVTASDLANSSHLLLFKQFHGYFNKPLLTLLSQYDSMHMVSTFSAGPPLHNPLPSPKCSNDIQLTHTPPPLFYFQLNDTNHDQTTPHCARVLRSRNTTGYNNNRGDRDRRDDRPSGPLTEIGTILHPCEETIVAQVTLKQKLPFPSAYIFLGENKKIGRVDEVLGPLDDVYLSVKLDNGILPSSFASGQKIFTTGDKIMPSSRVTEPKAPRGAAKPKFGERQPRGGPSGGRGGRGGSFGGGARGGSSGGRGGRGGYNNTRR